jgi:hypothetical protein
MIDDLNWDLNWTPRADGSCWDHTDGCFVEKDHPKRFSLYDDECRLLAQTSTLDAAYVAHSKIPGHGHLERGATPGRRKTNKSQGGGR